VSVVESLDGLHDLEIEASPDVWSAHNASMNEIRRGPTSPSRGRHPTLLSSVAVMMPSAHSSIPS
jgi:hypothetical protein